MQSRVLNTEERQWVEDSFRPAFNPHRYQFGEFSRGDRVECFGRRYRVYDADAVGFGFTLVLYGPSRYDGWSLISGVSTQDVNRIR